MILKVPHRKREVLIMELMQLIHTIKNLQRRLADQLKVAYSEFQEAYVEMGSEEIERANYAYLEPLELSIHERSVVPIPEVSAAKLPEKVKLGMMNSSPKFDSSSTKFSEVIPLLIEYAQANLTLTRLANEIKKTQRRVNALENIFIPDNEETIKYISDVLEENDREDFFRRKRIKKRSD